MHKTKHKLLKSLKAQLPTSWAFSMMNWNPLSSIKFQKLIKLLSQCISLNRILPDHPVIVLLLLLKQHEMFLLFHIHLRWPSISLSQLTAFNHLSLNPSSLGHYFWYFEGLVIAEKLFPDLPTPDYGRVSTPDWNRELISLRVYGSWSVSIVFYIKSDLAEVWWGHYLFNE